MLVKFNNLDLADETKFLIRDITGWDDMPELTNGSAARPRRHGMWPGGMLAPKRVVTVELEILADPIEGTVTKNLKELRKAMVLQDKESPLAVDLDYDLGLEEINARVSDFVVPMRQGYGVRRTAFIEFTATDPRRYTMPWQTKKFGTRTRMPVPVYPVKYPKPYVTYGNPGDLSVVNEGGIATPPVFRIVGPIIRPSITLTDTLQGTRKVNFDVTVGSGQELVIDTQAGTARMGATSYYGDTRGALIEDMLINPGISTIHFAGTGNNSQNARLTVEWRSANL
jgi:hypothetical protein